MHAAIPDLTLTHTMLTLVMGMLLFSTGILFYTLYSEWYSEADDADRYHASVEADTGFTGRVFQYHPVPIASVWFVTACELVSDIRSARASYQHRSYAWSLGTLGILAGPIPDDIADDSDYDTVAF